MKNFIASLSFQFHKGTIRTDLEKTNLSVGIDYFNSIKVRLEHKKEVLEFAKAKFQFHKGTIRTASDNDSPKW